jgi:hypothetical protein
VVIADLSGQVVQGLRFSAMPDTVLVRDENEASVPEEVRGYLDLLHVIEFDGYEDLLRRFLEVVPPNNLTQIRPSRQQMRMMLRTMVEDWISAQRDRKNGERFIHDDVDPKELEKEEQKQRDDAEKEKWGEPTHPFKRAADEAREARADVVVSPPPPERPLARAPAKRARARR